MQTTLKPLWTWAGAVMLVSRKPNCKAIGDMGMGTWAVIQVGRKKDLEAFVDMGRGIDAKKLSQGTEKPVDSAQVSGTR